MSRPLALCNSKSYGHTWDAGELGNHGELLSVSSSTPGIQVSHAEIEVLASKTHLVGSTAVEELTYQLSPKHHHSISILQLGVEQSVCDLFTHTSPHGDIQGRRLEADQRMTLPFVHY
jgi:hypothetical protein